MPVTISPCAGDGISTPAIRANISLPDTGTTITVQGTYQPPSLGAVPPNCQQPIVSFSGTATSPGVPGSGSNYMLIDVNTSTGAITTQTGTSPLNPTAGTWQLLAQTIATGQPSAISQQTGITIPWLSTVSPN